MSLFPTTRWSLILAAASPDDPSADAALESLCSAYWKPVYFFFRVSGCAHEEAEELVQEVMEQLIARGVLKSVDPVKGRFRTFLRVVAERQLLQERRRQRTLKRGGGFVQVPLQVLEEEVTAIRNSATADPRHAYDISWAHAVMTSVVEGLRSDYERAGKAEEFQLLAPYLTPGHDLPPYQQVAIALNSTEGAVKTAVYRLRKRFGSALMTQVAETLNNPEDAEEELRYLIRVAGPI